MVAFESALDATINSDVIDPGWWADPKWWLITAGVIIVIILVGIYMRALIENQRIGPDLQQIKSLTL